LKLLPGDEVVIAAPLDAQVRAREALGPEIPDAEARSRLPLRTVDVVVGRPEVVGRPLSELRLEAGPGLYANAHFRAGAQLPLGPETTLAIGDVIRVTGTEARIDKLAGKAGQVIRATHASDVLTLALGLLVGAALGAIPIPLFGLRISFGAAAVLVAGILFGWVKTRHPAFGGPVSEGGRQLMEELGLNVFTSVLAVNSGQAVYEILQDGPIGSLILSSILVSSVPALVAWWVGRHVLKMNLALLMGAVAGARQNTSSMQAAQEITRSAVPGIAYAVPLAITTVSLAVVSYLLALLS
jgi:putative transport protein